MKVAVNTITTKKNSGGVYQIAYNFLLASLKHQNILDWYYITSSDVDELVGKNFEHLRGSRYFVFPTQPDFKGTYKRVKKELALWEDACKPDIIYTISSPCYFTFKTTEVLRFANAWITNPNAESWSVLPWKEWLKMRLYRVLQIKLLRKAKYIITQSETVKKGLIKFTGIEESNIKVVPNVLPNIFLDANVTKSRVDNWLDVNCATLPMPHKNLEIIPEILKILKDKYDITNVRFNLTIPKGDRVLQYIVEKCHNNGQDYAIVNYGRCTQQQLIGIYNHCSFCLLSTLLETFSASSLEAMYFEQFIVATDYSFNREVVNDAGLYYKAMDANDAAEKIAMIIRDEHLRKRLLNSMRERIQLYNNYEKHFLSTTNFLVSVYNKQRT